MSDNPLRQLPSVTELLDIFAVQALAPDHAHEQIVAAVRAELDEVRQRLKGGEPGNSRLDPEEIAARVAQRVAHGARPRLERVINATGIVLHTNLGRAPLAEEAARAAYEAGRGYLNLELELSTGKRSSRQNAVRDGLRQLTGAESATVVNNCAAATVIALRALAAGREVVVSRGQLIEIGGSFRIPEIMAVSGAVLREVGTTNITRVADYEKSIGPNTALLMRIHTSNYRITGHTESTPLADLVALGQAHNLPVLDDVGSGALLDFSQFGFSGEPIVRESVAAGADLVLCSCDKLLGGPQAGIIAGKKELVQRIEKDPLMRAFRLDKMTLAALEATLRLYLNESRALAEVPVLRMLGTSFAELRQRAEALAAELRTVPGLDVGVSEGVAFVGGGSLPEQAMRTAAVSLAAAGISDEELATRLRTGTPAVLGRVHAGRLLLDVRTVFPEQEMELVEAIRGAMASA